MLPLRPGCSSARRRMASAGTPAALSSAASVVFWSVIGVLLPSDPHPRGLPALRVQG